MDVPTASIFVEEHSISLADAYVEIAHDEVRSPPYFNAVIVLPLWPFSYLVIVVARDPSLSSRR